MHSKVVDAKPPNGWGMTVSLTSSRAVGYGSGVVTLILLDGTAGLVQFTIGGQCC